MFSPPGLRTIALASIAIVIAPALAGCTTQEDGGIHAVITLDPAAWPEDGAFLFDHITVTATSTDGTQRAVACLFYSEEPEREVQSDTSSPTACADLHTAAWIGPPSLAGWRLDSVPRAVNFVFPSSTDVTIVAVAGLGGQLDVGKAVAVGTADVDYPNVTLSLLEDVPSIDPNHPCGATLKAVPDGFGTFVDAQPELCLSPTLKISQPSGSRPSCVSDSAYARGIGQGPPPPRHAETMACVGTASRVAGNVKDPCPGDDPALVWRAPIEWSSGCANALVTGHFARCADEACSTLTTDCTVPLAEIGVSEENETSVGVSFACLPPFVQPVTFLIKLDRPTPLDTAQRAAFFFHAPVGGVQNACFFDLYSVAFQPTDCAAP